MKLKTISTHNVKNKIVLVRVDYNVPLKKNQPKADHPLGRDMVVADDKRIAASIETINFLQNHGAKVILISHLGRPKNSKDNNLSLKPTADHLEKRFGIPVTFIADCLDESIREKREKLASDTVMVLENLRFYSEEKKNDTSFAKKLAAHADIYVNDAFSSAHRSHASTVGVTKFLPSFAGFAIVNEIDNLKRMLENPLRPFVCLIGGAKIADKVDAIRHLAKLADIILVGGGIANDFLQAEGLEIFRSFTDEPITATKDQEAVDFVDVARSIIQDHKTERMLMDGYVPLPKILYPVDVVAAPSLDTTNKEKIKTINLTHDMKDTDEHVKLVYTDIGPKTIKLYREILLQAGTIFWNGPMGVWENQPFSHGTHKLGVVMADCDAVTILGGGDTIAAVNHFGLENHYDHISSGGGAVLELLSGRMLPAIEPLIEKE